MTTVDQKQQEEDITATAAEQLARNLARRQEAERTTKEITAQLYETAPLALRRIQIVVNHLGVWQGFIPIAAIFARSVALLKMDKRVPLLLVLCLSRFEVTRRQALPVPFSL